MTPADKSCLCVCVAVHLLFPHGAPVSDETKNLNETETETFFRYQNFSIPNPILFSIPKFSETDTDTFFDTKNFRNRYRYFFQNLFFPKPIPILITIPFFSIPNPILFPITNISEFGVPVPGIPGIGNLSYFWWYRNRYRKKLVPEKSLGTDIGKLGT